jgi:hypothetical protein
VCHCCDQASHLRTTDVFIAAAVLSVRYKCSLALRNCLICSIVRSFVSFMLITILEVINPLANLVSSLSLQAHFWVEIQPSFRFIPHWTRLKLVIYKDRAYNKPVLGALLHDRGAGETGSR